MIHRFSLAWSSGNVTEQKVVFFLFWLWIDVTEKVLLWLSFCSDSLIHDKHSLIQLNPYNLDTVFTWRRVFLFVDVFSTYTFLTRMRSQSMQTHTLSHEELLLLFFFNEALWLWRNTRWCHCIFLFCCYAAARQQHRQPHKWQKSHLPQARVALKSHHIN